jgi:hypothetical protein
VWCLASTGKNEAGKSSVLEIVLWCLRGRAGLQRDVRSRMRRVRTEFVLDDEPRVVSKQTGAELASFDGMKAFEESMDAFRRPACPRGHRERPRRLTDC